MLGLSLFSELDSTFVVAPIVTLPLENVEP